MSRSKEADVTCVVIGDGLRRSQEYIEMSGAMNCDASAEGEMGGLLTTNLDILDAGDLSLGGRFR